jgi:hypothetical protein
MRSQMGGPPPSPPVGTKEDPAKAVDGLLSMMEFQVVGAALNQSFKAQLIKTSKARSRVAGST